MLRPTTLTRVLICLGLLLLSACGGGRKGIIPVITAIVPSGVVGITATEVRFTAIVGNLLPESTYRWNFGGGATPNTPTEAEPLVTLSAAGSYAGSLQVCNPDGCSSPFSFAITIGEPTDPPVITAVNPSEGFVGEMVEFVATAINAPVTWSWEFGGGATPNTATDVRPKVTLGAEGTYTGRVTATNAAGPSLQFEFAFTVMQPTEVPAVTAVTPGGNAGRSGQHVTFKGTATQGPTAWNWAFGGGGLPNTSTAFQPSVQLERPGTYMGTVTATNNLGASMPFDFSYNVTMPIAPNWTSGTVSTAANAASAGYAITTQDNRLLVAFRDPSQAGLLIAKAKNALPRQVSDWEIYELNPGVGLLSGFSPSFAVVNGKLSVAHVRVRSTTLDEPTVLYSRASSLSPNGPADWSTTVVSQETANGVRLLGLPSGRPAVVFTGALNRPRVAVGSKIDPGAPGDWNLQFIGNASLIDPADAAVVNGKIQVVMGGGNGLKHVRTDQDHPSLIGQWNVHEPSPGLATSRLPKIIDVNGFPVIAASSSANENNSQLLVFRGTVNQPASSSNWIAMVADSGPRSGLAVDLMLVDNRIVISQFQAVSAGTLYELQVVRALASDPSVPNDWQKGVIQRSSALVPANTRLMVLSDRLRLLATRDPGLELGIYHADQVW